MKSTTLIASLIIATGLNAGPALGTNTAMLPTEKVQGAVSYITGGIGEDESAAFKQAATAFPLEMLFVQKARPRDEFLADVRVSVRDRAGNLMLETIAEGPFLLAKLPDGKYTIDAEYGGERKRHSVDIRSGTHQRAVFAWAPRDEIEGSVVSSAN